MYLSGSKWSMRRKRRKHSNPWRILIIVLFIAAAVYVNQIVVPATPPFFIPTVTPTINPESFVNEAEAFYSEGKLRGAIESYEQAILADPGNSAIYVSLSRVQILAGRYEDGLENAELALLRNPGNPIAHAMRAWALDFMGDYLEAEAAIKRALELDKNNPVAHAVYAEILVDKGDFEGAAEESRIAVELDPTSLETRRARGYVLYWTSNYEMALEEYKAALAINNKIPNLYIMTGYIYSALGDYDLAVENFNQANALNPDDPTPEYEASRVYFTIGEFAQAAQYAQQAVEDDPANASLQGNLGVMYAKNNELDKAIVHLTLAVQGGITGEGEIVEGIPISYKVRSIEIYSLYGLTLARLNRCGEAIPIFQSMLALVPDNEIAVYNATTGLEMCQAGIEETSPETGPPDS
ncbi:MAG: tetratricopeptide repeat protein [Chloroflexi bacterium]|nr:tetratricopeptide repeat protein [Chloroflexota bacterium]